VPSATSVSEKQAFFAFATLTAIPVGASCGTGSPPIDVRIVIGQKTANAAAVLTSAEQSLRRERGFGRSDADVVEPRRDRRVLFLVDTQTLSDAPS
jgi:hypothetical protein